MSVLVQKCNMHGYSFTDEKCLALLSILFATVLPFNSVVTKVCLRSNPCLSLSFVMNASIYLSLYLSCVLLKGGCIQVGERGLVYKEGSWNKTATFLHIFSSFTVFSGKDKCHFNSPFLTWCFRTHPPLHAFVLLLLAFLFMDALSLMVEMP